MRTLTLSFVAIVLAGAALGQERPAQDTGPTPASAPAAGLGAAVYKQVFADCAARELKMAADIAYLTPSSAKPYAFENTAALAVGWRITGDRQYLDLANKGLELLDKSLDANGLYPIRARGVFARVPVYQRYLAWWLDRPELGKAADRHLMAMIDQLRRSPWPADSNLVLFHAMYGPPENGYPPQGVPTIDPNQNADIAHAYALALRDPASVFHGQSKQVANQRWYAGKTYGQVAREILGQELNAVYALQKPDGGIRLEQGYQDCQTNYGAYALLHLAAISAATGDPEVRRHLAAGAKWLQRYSGDKPPYNVRVWQSRGNGQGVSIGDWFARLVVLPAAGLDASSFRDRGYAGRLPTDGFWGGGPETWADHMLPLYWVLPAHYAGVAVESYAGSAAVFALPPPKGPPIPATQPATGP